MMGGGELVFEMYYLKFENQKWPPATLVEIEVFLCLCIDV